MSTPATLVPAQISNRSMQAASTISPSQRFETLKKEAEKLKKNPTEAGLRRFLSNTKPEVMSGGNLNRRQLHEQYQAAVKALIGSNHQSPLWSNYKNTVHAAATTTGQSDGQRVTSEAYDKVLEGGAEESMVQPAPAKPMGSRPSIAGSQRTENLDNREGKKTFKGDKPVIVVIDGGFHIDPATITDPNDSSAHGAAVEDVPETQLGDKVKIVPLEHPTFGNGRAIDFQPVLDHIKDNPPGVDYLNLSSITSDVTGKASSFEDFIRDYNRFQMDKSEKTGEPAKVFKMEGESFIRGVFPWEETPADENVTTISPSSKEGITPYLDEFRSFVKEAASEIEKNPSLDGKFSLQALYPHLDKSLDQLEQIMDSGTDVYIGAGNNKGAFNLYGLAKAHNQDSAGGKAYVVGATNDDVYQSNENILPENIAPEDIAPYSSTINVDFYTGGTTDSYGTPGKNRSGTSFASPEAIVNDIISRTGWKAEKDLSLLGPSQNSENENVEKEPAPTKETVSPYVLQVLADAVKKGDFPIDEFKAVLERKGYSDDEITAVLEEYGI